MAYRAYRYIGVMMRDILVYKQPGIPVYRKNSPDYRYTGKTARNTGIPEKQPVKTAYLVENTYTVYTSINGSKYSYTVGNSTSGAFYVFPISIYDGDTTVNPTEPVFSSIKSFNGTDSRFD